jgi:long-chain acyl-CoA synthetase
VSDDLRRFAVAVNANLAAILDDPPVPEAVALVDAGREVGYAELASLVRGAAGTLAAAGVGPGDRVAIVLPNGLAFVAAFFGALRIGAVVVPLNVLLSPRELEDRYDATAPSAVVTEPLAYGGEAPLVERGASDPAVILFTSGTSGVSKGAVLTHGGIRAAALNAAHALAFDAGDVVLGAAPFSHVLGQSTGLVGTLATGGTVAVVARFEPAETLDFMARTGTTVLLGVPTMCVALCGVARSAGRLPPLRVAHVGGAPVPVEVTRDFEATFGAEVYEGYGLTEISGIATTYRHGQQRKAGSVGFPLGDTELRIVSAAPGEIGEVQFRGSSVIPGYWGGAGAELAPVSEDGWLATGDLGFVDGDGYLFLVDRLKDMIIRNGYNVYPREVEEALYAHPAVLEAAVVGVPDARIGEEVVALVRPRPDVECDPADVQAWAKERVAAYKYPRHVVLVDSLPTGPTGKILKREIDLQKLARELL